MRLQDNVALITGASKGLGLEIARLYAERGARLVIAARHSGALEQAAAELRQKTEVVSVAQLVLPQMRARATGVIINVTSDAGVEAYAGWGGYGASKAALEHLSRVLAEELAGSGIRVYVVDPGDMNTEMHRHAEPGVDLSGLPGPEVSAPAFVRLVEDEIWGFGRFKAQEMAAVAETGR